MNDEIVVARKGPYGVLVEKGKTYYWCACGRSRKQPFCDGSHEQTAIEPVKFVAEENVMVAFCGCKRTSCGPFCDDSHRHIKIDESPVDESKKPRIF